MEDVFERIANLTPQQRELFIRRLQRDVSVSPAQKIPRRTEAGPPPLSFAQQRLWFLHQLAPDSPAPNLLSAGRLAGVLDVAALERSLGEIVRRHESLRTTFPAVEGRPVQAIAPAPAAMLPVVALEALAKAGQEAEVWRLAFGEVLRPFDLSRDLLLRATLLRLDATQHVLLLTTHHIASDGWSIGVLIREMAALYTAFAAGRPSPLPELPIQYADFAVWQRQWLQGEVLAAQLAYWRQQLDGAPAALELPSDRPRPPLQTLRGAHQSLALPPPLAGALEALSRRQGATLFVTLLAAFETLLYRYTGQADVAVGTPIANRNRSEVEGLIGFFVNTLVLRTDLTGDPSFRELLGRVREVALGAYAHQDLPFEKLVEELQPVRDLSRTPLFQVMFMLQNAPMPPLELPGLTLCLLEYENGMAQFDLTLAMSNTGGGLAGSLEYNTDLFDAAAIARLLEHWQTLLEGIVADSEQRISALPLLAAAERQQLLNGWNDTQADAPADSRLHRLFEAQVERTPDAVAVVFEDEHLTYRTLNRRANRLAHYLQGAGVGPEVCVGVCVERSLALVAGILGVLKAGGAYAPLDPAYPPARLAFTWRDARLAVLLAQEQPAAAPVARAMRLVCLDSVWEVAAPESSENPTGEVMAGNVACVIYTSGSTGQPKGVWLEHKSIANLIASFARCYSPGADDRTLPLTSISSASFVGEMFPPLCSGGALVLLPQVKVVDVAELVASISKLSVTIVSAAPSLIAGLNSGENGFARLRLLLSGGEALSSSDVDRLCASVSVVNGYGLTETTICSTFYRLHRRDSNPGGAIPIGQPVMNHCTYILDEALHCAPTGCPGELYVAGSGLARGYLNNPGLTAERFVPHPYTPGERMYRTGDRARWLPGGVIEFLGRVDRQVKLRGFRIELAEIEAVLAQHPAVREAVVLAREDAPGKKRLAAYVVPAREPAPSAGEWQGFLKERLPDYMLPAAFVLLDALPRTAGGKVDRRALPAPEGLRPELEAAYVAPRTAMERAIAAVWREALQVDRVGVHDNFFDLGGHSLLLAQVHSKLRQVLDGELSMIDLFKYPTVDALTRYLSTQQKEPPSFQQSHERAEARKEAIRQMTQLTQQRRATKVQEESGNE